MEWIREQDEAGERHSFCSEVGNHAAAHRPPGPNHGLGDVVTEPFDHRSMTGEQALLGIGPATASLGVGIVEREDRIAGGGDPISQPNDRGVVLIGACAVSQ
jgi:hypothetical protein